MLHVLLGRHYRIYLDQLLTILPRQLPNLLGLEELVILRTGIAYLFWGIYWPNERTVVTLSQLTINSKSSLRSPEIHNTAITFRREAGFCFSTEL